MEKVNSICRHSLYQKALRTIERQERKRRFCRHDMEHFLSVARLAYIYSLQDGAGLDPALIYGAALLHDAGRSLEYEEGIPHHKAGVLLAEQILPDCGFEDEERKLIVEAIGFHRQEAGQETESRKSGGWDASGRDGKHLLRQYLYRADKESRLCFSCGAREDCKWPEKRQNLKISL